MNKINEYSFHTKDDMLNKLRAYTHNPDDDNIRIKNQVYQILLHCPELLYAIHDAELESELFDDDGNLELYFEKYKDENNLEEDKNGNCIIM